MTPFSIFAFAAILCWLWIDTWGSVMLPLAAGVAAAWGCGYVPGPLVPQMVLALLGLRIVLWAWDLARG